MAAVKDYQLVGKRAFLNVAGDMRMAVTVIDVKRVYGRLIVLVEPRVNSGGHGEAWVNADTLQER